MNDRAAKLLERAGESVEAAKVLQREGHSGFAASRAYYAMFYAASAMLAEDGLSFTKHAAVHAEFGRLYAKTGRIPVELHRHFLEAAETRHEADYDTAVRVPSEVAAIHIARAEEFVAVVERNLGSQWDPP